jgi:hypothetical protein
VGRAKPFPIGDRGSTGADAAGLPVTPFQVAYSLAGVAEPAERLGRPVVVKPVLGGGATMDDRVGDVNRGRIGSSALTGVVHLRVGDETEVYRRMPEVAERYALEVEVEDAAPGR